MFTFSKFPPFSLSFPLPPTSIPVSLFFSRADLDPIYYCELLRACPVKDDGDAHIMSFTVKPNDVEYG